MSNPTGTAEVQEEEMFGRITNRIDALIKGNANFEQLKGTSTPRWKWTSRRTAYWPLKQ